MNIELTKDQYEILLKLMYCGEWVLNSHKTSEDKAYKETDKFEQHIFSYAKEFKMDKLIEYDNEEKKYYPTALMEDNIHKYIDMYNARQRKK
jgi:hypothetical protein